MGGEMRRAKSLRIGVHNADAVVWGPVYSGGGGGGGFGDIETAVVESVSSSDDGSETYRVGQPRVKT
jgi:hypothetical protein